MRRAIMISGIAAALAVLASAVAIAAVNWTITLKSSTSYPNATGSSQYQSQGSQRELQVEVEHLRSLAGQHVNIFVNGSKWASPTVSSLGIAQVDKNTDAGQTVPTINHGSTVRVRTTSGTLIAGGTY